MNDTDKERFIATARKSNEFHGAHGEMQVVGEPEDGKVRVRCQCHAILMVDAASPAPTRQPPSEANTPRPAVLGNRTGRVFVKDGKDGE